MTRNAKPEDTNKFTLTELRRREAKRLRDEGRDQEEIADELGTNTFKKPLDREWGI